MREQSASRVNEATVRMALAASQAVEVRQRQSQLVRRVPRNGETYPFERIEREIFCSVDP